jgi:hypothetical protein
MPKKLSKEERSLLQEAGVPALTEIVFATDIIGRKFSFTFDDPVYPHQGVTLHGVIGSIQIYVWTSDEHNIGNRVIITPTAPFPTLNSGLVSGFYYNAGEGKWRINGISWEKGKILF